MEELNSLEVQEVSGGLDWMKGERSDNVYYTDSSGDVFHANIYGGWTRVYLP
jgi:hypothetical protein